MRPIAPPFAILALLAAPAGAQQVLVVAPSPGPGVFATAIQPAVDAAADGDVILVKTGSYAGFLITAKSLTVAADAGATVAIASQVSVFGLAAGQRVALRGLQIRLPLPDTSSTSGVAAATATNSAGPIWFEECAIEGGGAYAKTPWPASLAIFGCASVALERCFVRGGLRWTSGLSWGAVGLNTTNSNVYVHDSAILGGDAPPFALSQFHPAGGEGIHNAGGFLYLSGSLVSGGRGGDVSQAGSAGGDGGDGIVAQGVTVALDTFFLGGAGGSGGPGAAAGAVGSPGVVIGGSFAALPGAARHFATTSPAREQQVSTWTAGGAPGELAAAIVAPAPDVGALLQPFAGPLLVAAAGASVLPLGALPPSGVVTVPLPIPDLPPSLLGGTLFVQSFFVDVPLASVRLGPVSAVLLLDASL